MVDPEVIIVNPNIQNILYSCSTRPHTGDYKIEVLLLLYSAKLQVMREMMPPVLLYSIYVLRLWTLYIDNKIGTVDFKTVSLG